MGAVQRSTKETAHYNMARTNGQHRTEQKRQFVAGDNLLMAGRYKCINSGIRLNLQDEKLFGVTTGGLQAKNSNTKQSDSPTKLT